MRLNQSLSTVGFPRIRVQGRSEKYKRENGAKDGRRKLDSEDQRWKAVALRPRTRTPRCFSSPLFFPLSRTLLHLGFRIDAESIGNPVNVVEIGDHLHRIEDVPVVQSVQAEGLQVLRANRGRSASEQLGEFAQGLLTWSKPGEFVVVFDVFGKLRIVSFLTEILSVCFDSIEAMVRPGNNSRQHFAVGAPES